MRGRVGSATVVTVHRTIGMSTHPDVVAVTPERPFAEAWNAAMAGKRRRRLAGARR
jgi:hypothetical protein